MVLTVSEILNSVPVITTNSLTISEGGSVVLGTSEILAFDAEDAAQYLQYSASNIVGGQFELVNASGVAVTTFSQAQINAGQVVFVHNGGEAAPSYTLSLTDGMLTSDPSNANVTFSSVNDSPMIVANSISIAEGASVLLNTASISSNDPDTPATSLTYSVSGLSGGQFELVTAPGVPVTTFSQFQIDSGEVQFLHDGGESAPAYTLIVNDGQLASLPLAASVTFTNVNDAPVIASGLNNLSVNQGAPNQVVSLLTAFADVDDATLIYSVSSSNSALVDATISGSSLVLGFSMTQAGTAFITVTATDAAGLFVSTTFEVTVNSVGPVTGVTLINGVLTITGTSDCDIVLIEKICSQYVVLTNFTSPAAMFFNVSDVSRIAVDVLGGHDLVMIGCSVSAPATILGGDGHDILMGGGGPNTIDGGIGGDAIVGGSSDDMIDGGSGDDEIEGGAGNDTIYGGDGDDEIEAGCGDDTVYAGAGDDEIEGDEGNDTIFAGADDDEIEGGDGADLLFGEAGDDEIEGDDGADVLSGGSGNDELRGGKGRDLLIGGLGSDELRGEHEDDILVANQVTFEDETAALQAVLAEWNSGRSYSARVANIRGPGASTRLNGSYFLNSTTVLSDNAVDQLFGSNGQDWFIGTIGQDLFRDRNGNEFTN